MKNKMIITGLFTSLILGSTASFAESGISANVTMASEYVTRGLTQTDDEPTIQGSLDYNFGNGFALGIWASNVSYKDATGNLLPASAEFDLYGSYSGNINEDISYKTGYIAYRYTDQAEFNFEDWFVSGSYKGFNLIYYIGLGSPAEDYAVASYKFNLDVVDFTVLYGDWDNNHDYYGFGFSKSYAGLDFALKYTDTDPDNNSEGQDNTLLSVSKSF